MPQLGPYTLTVARAIKLAHAVGVAKNLGRDATQQEVDDWLKEQAIQLVRNTDMNEAIAAASVEPAPIVFT